MSAELRGKRVLIVDDLEHNRYLLRMMLAHAGCEVLEASNGLEAIAHLEAGPVDLIISDILMPEMDGYALCRRCKAHEQWKSIPFVFYTATYTTREDERFALSLGASRFIIKPQDHKVFLQAMNELLREWKAESLKPAEAALESEEEYLRLYNARLVQKLEDKITQLEEANQKLTRELQARREAEKKAAVLLAAIEQAGEAIIITDASARIIYVNRAFTRITGYSEQEAVGRNPSMLASGEQDDAFYRRFWETLAGKRSWSGPIVDRRKDGSTYIALMAVSPVVDGDGNITHYVGIQQDMTEYKQLEARFHEAQKMEAIGTLAGGIAHDFNNMLAAILMSAHLLKSNHLDAERAMGYIANIQNACERAQKMIQQLLTFARKDSPRIEPMDLGETLRQTMELARASIPENIAMQLELPDEAVPIRGCDAQIEQMLLNLLHNARDALEATADPRIHVRLDCIEDERLGRCAVIEVSDNGPGIPESHRQHIFDPFYTTKDVGRGTGLGLAMVFGGMQNHGGRVQVESVPGKTVFRLYFPLISEALESAAGDEGEVRLRGDGQTILVADDNEFLRETMTDVLESMGFAVLAADSGSEALACLSRLDSRPALAILDVVMPGLDGVAAAREMRRIFPDMPLLFMTGYDTDKVLPNSLPLLAPCEVLKKPFPMERFCSLVQKLIADHPEASRKRGP